MVTVPYVAERTALGDAILRLRKRAGLTQEYVARVAGVERSYISMLEKGERANASESVLRNIARALGVTTAELYREAEMHWAEAEGADAARTVITPDPLTAAVLRRLTTLFSIDVLLKLEQIGRVGFLESGAPKQIAETEETETPGEHRDPDEPEADAERRA